MNSSKKGKTRTAYSRCRIPMTTISVNTSTLFVLKFTRTF